MAVNRTVVVFISLGILLTIIVIFLLVWAMKPSGTTPTPTCQCKPDEICINGSCVPKTICGPQIVPTGEHCDAQALICDSESGKWHCDGPTKCDYGFEGIYCSCDMSKRPPVSDVCNGQIPVCNNDGTYTVRDATTCSEIFNYFNASGTTIDNICHDQCKGSSCGAHGICQCKDYQGEPQINCFENCTPAPDPSLGECSSDGKTLNCPDQQTCICDITTGYDWKCSVNFDSTVNTCPPIPPHPTYCPSGDLQCVPCVYDGVQGSVRYCPGSGGYPENCLKQWFGLESHTISGTGPTQYWTSHIQNDLPVFPTVDNVRCEAGQTSNTYLQDSLGLFYEPVNNPSGNIDASGNFIPFNSDLYPYYVSTANPANACLWTTHSTCSNRGQFHQYCHEAGTLCDNNDPISSRLKDGKCFCDNYIDPSGNQAVYQGCNCELDNSVCNNKGQLSTTCQNGVINSLSCSCSTYTGHDGKPAQYQGCNCEYSDSDCSGHGSAIATCTNGSSGPYSLLGCKCDPGYGGNKCSIPTLGCWQNNTICFDSNGVARTSGPNPTVIGTLSITGSNWTLTRPGLPASYATVSSYNVGDSVAWYDQNGKAAGTWTRSS